MSRPLYVFIAVPGGCGGVLQAHMRRELGERCAFARLPAELDRIEFIGGRAACAATLAAFPDRDIRISVLLRDPVGLALAAFNERNRQALQRGRKPLAFETFRASLPLNPVSRFLLSRWHGLGARARLALDSAARFARVESVLSSFWFVGSWWQEGQLAAAIAAGLGAPTMVLRDARSESAGPAEEDLPAAVVAAIREENAVDQLLFERWKDAGWAHAPAADITRDLPHGDRRRYLKNALTRRLAGRGIEALPGT